MELQKSLFILLMCSTIQFSAHAGSYNQMLEAQFLNTTEDVKVGLMAKIMGKLPFKAEDVDIVEVCTVALRHISLLLIYRLII